VRSSRQRRTPQLPPRGLHKIIICMLKLLRRRGALVEEQVS